MTDKENEHEISKERLQLCQRKSAEIVNILRNTDFTEKMKTTHLERELKDINGAESVYVLWYALFQSTAETNQSKLTEETLRETISELNEKSRNLTWFWIGLIFVSCLMSSTATALLIG